MSISSFRRWVHATLPDEVTRAQVTVLRDEVEPGEEAQIDTGSWGSGPTRAPANGTGSGRS
ncbi:hypothetical protein [Streptomyces coelicoflavus]|uniref:hypothetical protein n=1 Tax=Streptomyces coelicoflavus TaxID=285562 RepID=UPI00333352B9